MKNKAKSLAINLSKMGVVALLLMWMINSGKLNLNQMGIFLTNPYIVVAGISIWVVGPVLLGAWRWWLLLKGAGLKCTYSKAVFYQLIGFFFNTAMPGAVGGDIVKAIYIVKDQKESSGKTSALLTVLLDRIVGLIGLFVMGALTAWVSRDSLSTVEGIQKLVYGLGFFTLGSMFFLTIIFVPYPSGKDPFLSLLSKPAPGLEKIKGIYIALRSYRNHPKIIFGTIALSIVIQFIFLVFMGFIGSQMYPDFNFNLLAPIYPFGILITALPLAPGGLGVGHAAFDKLFTMVGLPGGANVFNIFTLSQLALNLLCFIPYLTVRKSINIDELDQEAQN